MSRPKLSADEQVLEIARSVFRARGYSASTRRIAAKVGLSQPALIQRFGSKRDLFLAAMMPEPLDIDLILYGGRSSDSADFEDALFGMAERLYEQIRARVPLVLLLEQNPDIDPGAVETARIRLGVPKLIDALCARVSDLKPNRAQYSEETICQFVEALLLAAHGATLMSLAGAPPQAVTQHLSRFCHFNQQRLRQEITP